MSFLNIEIRSSETKDSGENITNRDLYALFWQACLSVHGVYTYCWGHWFETTWSFPNERAFYKWAWQRVKVLPRPLASKSKLSMIRPLKWGTLCLWNPTGFKMASRQSWKIKENVRLTSKTDVFSFFQLWRLAILKPVGIQRCNVPHFKGLIMLNLDFKAQGRGSPFTFCHTRL